MITLRWKVVVIAALLALVGSLPSVLSAAEVEGLYETEVRVFSQSAAEKQAALRAALAEVVVKVTGQRTAPAALGLAGAFKRVDQFVQQYRYRLLAESKLMPLPVTPPPVVIPVRPGARKPGGASQQPPQVKPVTPVGKEQALWVSFDSAAVNKVVRQAGLPLWGRSRPATLMVLAVEEPSNHYLLLADSGSPLQTIMETRAWWRGLPLVLPQRAEAEGGIRFLEAWNNSQEPLLRAAAHERADATLLGRMTPQGATWRVRWTLFQVGETAVQWESAGDSTLNVLEAGIDGAADALGKRFAQLLSDKASNIVLITVTDIVTLDHYAKVLSYLQSLDEVAEVTVSQVKANSVTYRVAARGTTQTLSRTIALSKKLSPIVTTAITDPLSVDAPPLTTETETPVQAEPVIPGGSLPTPAGELKYQLLQ